MVRQLPGFDLPRLMCGSFGTLGVIAEATVRVHPMPAGRAWVIRPVATPRDVQELTYALLASSFAPVAIECDLPTVPGAPLAPGWSAGPSTGSGGRVTGSGGRVTGSGGREGGWSAAGRAPRTGELAVLLEGAS